MLNIATDYILILVFAFKIYNALQFYYSISIIPKQDDDLNTDEFSTQKHKTRLLSK